jgi:8-oxo-dGTP pyrophosphatase MutT (NUDIX family)
MNANAEIILARGDGSVILQVRDDKPGITNPGLISTFGGHIEDGEEPKEAAVREINEETNLNLTLDDLELFGKYHKTREVHGEGWDVYYFVAKNVSEKDLEVYEGAGYTILRDKTELSQAKTTILLQQVLSDFFDSAKSEGAQTEPQA